MQAVFSLFNFFIKLTDIFVLIKFVASVPFFRHICIWLSTLLNLVLFGICMIYLFLLDVMQQTINLQSNTDIVDGNSTLRFNGFLILLAKDIFEYSLTIM